MTSENHVHSVPRKKQTEYGLQENWNQCLEIMKENISPQGFRTWLLPIIPVNHIDEKLILRVPSQFFFEWLETNFQQTIHKAVKKIFGIRVQIEYLVASTPKHHPEEINLDEEKTDAAKNPDPEKYEEDELDSRSQFENFMAQNDNELALRAAQTVAKNPGKTDYNPLFIYGETGCGKTHLLNAVGNYIKQKSKRKQIRYLNSENFLNEYIYALQKQELESLNKKFEKIDVLLFDDIQFLSNKKKSQQGLYFFLSQLGRWRKQIVITSNQSPAQLIGFDHRLISFFQQGLIVDLIPAGYDTRIQWIDSFCHKNNVTILPEVRQFLAESLTEGLHQLRAVMVRIAAQTSLLGKSVSLKKTKRLLSHIDINWARKNGDYKRFKPVKIERIIKAVSEYLNIPEDLLVGFCRQREISFARQIAIFLCKELSNESLKVIGYHFGDRHYTGILHNYKKIQKEMKNNPLLNNMILEIKNKLLSV